MIWSDTMLWQIHPHYVGQVSSLLEKIRSEGLHRDNLDRKITRTVAGWLDLDELPVDRLPNGIAVVTVTGPLVKEWTYWTASYRALTAAFRMCRESADVKAVVVKFDTPGGTVDGLWDCASELTKLADEKLTIAQIDGGCYSAGYYLAAFCGEIHCGPTNHVGNIGTVLSLVDASEAYRAKGLRSVTLKTGEIKGVGIEGDPVTEPQQEFLQDLVDQHFMHFKAAIMNGRGMSDEQFAAVSDGSWWLGEKALGLGLVDRISTLEETLKAVGTYLAQKELT